VRAPGRRVTELLQGPSAAAAVLPRSPLRLAEEYSNYSLARLWLILAGPMASAINNLSAPSSEASGGHLRGCEATSGLTTGGSGGCLWLAARIVQHRCESEWRHFGKRGGGLHSQPTAHCPQVPTGRLRLAQLNPLKSVCWH